MNKFPAYATVKVTDKDYERFGQVGVYVGPGEERGTAAVKFEGEGAGAAQVIDDFPEDAVEVV
jgi:hypothetical protein